LQGTILLADFTALSWFQEDGTFIALVGAAVTRFFNYWHT
jgi:hypothetical protein